MNKNQQTVNFRQSVIKYANAYGVPKASQKFNLSQRTIYYWKARYDGTLQSLTPKSRRPHRSPAQHSAQEYQIIQNSIKRNPNLGLVMRYIKLRERGYTRSLSGLYRALQHLGYCYKPLPNPKRSSARPYEQMTYPGQRIQIDVKYVPKVCFPDRRQVYQFTAIDEYSRFRFLKAYEEHSTYSAADFLRECIKRFPFPIECVQTDNGVEFVKWKQDPTKQTPTLFQSVCTQHGIKHKTIRPYTPRHNGKVERSHRKDNQYFYASHSFYSFQDLETQLARWNREYNNTPMLPLKLQSPKAYLQAYLAKPANL